MVPAPWKLLLASYFLASRGDMTKVFKVTTERKGQEIPSLNNNSNKINLN